MNQQTILNKEDKIKSFLDLLFQDNRFLKFNQEDKFIVIDLVICKSKDYSDLPKVRKAYINGIIKGLI